MTPVCVCFHASLSQSLPLKLPGLFLCFGTVPEAALRAAACRGPKQQGAGKAGGSRRREKQRATGSKTAMVEHGWASEGCPGAAGRARRALGEATRGWYPGDAHPGRRAPRGWVSPALPLRTRAALSAGSGVWVVARKRPIHLLFHLRCWMMGKRLAGLQGEQETHSSAPCDAGKRLGGHLQLPEQLAPRPGASRSCCCCLSPALEMPKHRSLQPWLRARRCLPSCCRQIALRTWPVER